MNYSSGSYSRRPQLSQALKNVGADLRAEPLLFSVPKVEKGRYYSLQFKDI